MLAYIVNAQSITITTSEIAYLVVAAIVGIIAEFIVGWRLPLGFVGAIIASLIGIWVFTHIIPLSISGDPVIYGVPIIRTLIGAILFVIIWHALTLVRGVVVVAIIVENAAIVGIGISLLSRKNGQDHVQ